MLRKRTDEGMKKFTIDEIEIIELGGSHGWADYNHAETWEGFFAYYAPELDQWILSKRHDWVGGEEE